MKKKILYGIVAMMCATIGGVKAYDGLTQNEMSALMVENIEALTNSEADLWFANLRWIECTLTKVNAGGAFYYKEVLIPAGGTYTVYGSKQRCEREITINTCYLSDETPCKEV